MKGPGHKPKDPNLIPGPTGRRNDSCKLSSEHRVCAYQILNKYMNFRNLTVVGCRQVGQWAVSGELCLPSNLTLLSEKWVSPLTCLCLHFLCSDSRDHATLQGLMHFNGYIHGALTMPGSKTDVAVTCIEACTRLALSVMGGRGTQGGTPPHCRTCGCG